MDDFNFYLKLAKPLLLNLPDAKDRTTAALWLKKLCDVNSRASENSTDTIHVEYLKLLLLAMQANRLTGIFKKPPSSENLHHLAAGRKKATEMISLIKKGESTDEEERSIVNSCPRVVTSIGGDMCEYVAVQEIPNFGIHGYYALSTEPLSKWSIPGSSGTTEAKVSTACFKNTCESLGINVGNREKDVRGKDSKKKSNSAAPMAGERSEASNQDENLKKKHEKPRHSQKSLQKIFQAQRSEIAGVETRPCWGRSRYIDRLIDESPHVVGDLDLSEADALLHLYRDKKMRKIKNTAGQTADAKACAVSSRRRKVEARLDSPPCAFIPDKDDLRGQEAQRTDGSRTCLPPNFDLLNCGMIEEDEICDDYSDENDRYYPIEPIASEEECFADLSLPSDNFMDDEYEAELRERRDYDDYRDYGFEPPENYAEQDSRRLDNPDLNTSKSVTISNDPEDVQDMHRLVEDPHRREPPSRGHVKRPRRKPKPSATEKTNSPLESWEPAAHSTRV